MVDEFRAAVQLGQVQQRIEATVKVARAEGAIVPCLTERCDWWVSERAVERARAARKCVDCPLLAVCDELAHAADASWGVWAGRDYSPRKLRARLPVSPEQDPDAARLRALGRLPMSAERRAERNRLIVELRQRDPQYWTYSRLGEAGGLSKTPAYLVVSSGGRTSGPRAELTAENRRRRREYEAARLRRDRERMAAVDDPRLVRLRQLRGTPRGAVGAPARAERNELLAELALSDPWWTYERLGLAVGMSTFGVRSGVLLVLRNRHERKRGTSIAESA